MRGITHRYMQACVDPTQTLDNPPPNSQHHGHHGTESFKQTGYYVVRVMTSTHSTMIRPCQKKMIYKDKRKKKGHDPDAWIRLHGHFFGSTCIYRAQSNCKVQHCALFFFFVSKFRNRFLSSVFLLFRVLETCPDLPPTLTSSVENKDSVSELCG